MKITNETESVQVTRQWTVEDVEPVDGASWNSIQVLPDTVTAVWRDGELTNLEVWGYRMLSGGRVSDKSRHKAHTLNKWSRDQWPAWLTELIGNASPEPSRA